MDGSTIKKEEEWVIKGWILREKPGYERRIRKNGWGRRSMGIGGNEESIGGKQESRRIRMEG